MWIYQEKEFLIIPKKAIGFIYQIIDLYTNEVIVGKKMFYTTDGAKESDWKTFYGKFKKESKKNPTRFNRIILSIHKDKKTMVIEKPKKEVEYVNEWEFNNEKFYEKDIPSNIDSFVYLITNNINGRKYIGKKTFFFTKSKIINGRKKNGKSPSDWFDYYGSNDELIKDVELNGKENFKREILYLCNTRGKASYLELREQIDRRVLESNDYYNSWIKVRIAKSHLGNFSI